MSNLDAEIVAWISKALVVKGGQGSGAQPGHAFNGNQWTSASGGKREQAFAGEGATPFSGNQYPKPNWGDKNLTPKSLANVKVNEGETKTAAQIMEAVTRYADAHPDTMQGYSDKASHEKFIAEHEDAIPKWLSDRVTQKDVDVLEDNNYHTANTVIADRRPDLGGWNSQKALAQWDKYKSVSEIAKGDSPGHPFRGNQYAQAPASATDNLKMVRGRAVIDEPAVQANIDHFTQVAQEHTNQANQHAEAVAELQARIAEHERAGQIHLDAAGLARQVADDERELSDPEGATDFLSSLPKGVSPLIGEASNGYTYAENRQNSIAASEAARQATERANRL